MRVVRIDPIAEEIIYELLSKASYLHICVHVDVLDLKAVSLEHFTDGDNVRMDLAP